MPGTISQYARSVSRKYLIQRRITQVVAVMLHVFGDEARMDRRNVYLQSRV